MRALFVALCCLLPAFALAQDFQTKAKQAILMDYETGTVLFQKNADQPMPPASMAKLMTMEVVFDQLKSGVLTMESPFDISEDAWRRGGATSGGSTMFARLNDTIRLEDLIKGVIIVSANDASIAIAEGLAGSESGFAGMMNQRARKIGLENSTFRNATGLPDPEQLVTARDLAKLARHIIRTYPEYYGIYSEGDFTWNKVRQRNRNPLLGNIEGADGLKTGFTEASGYGLVGTAERDGRRLIVVLNGMSSKRERQAEAVKLMRWGQRAFREIEIATDDAPIGEAEVFGGTSTTVALRTEGPLKLYVPAGRQDRLRAEIVYEGPLQAPVEAGQRVGKLEVRLGDEVSQETPLFAAEDVPVGNIQQRALSAFKELTLGWSY